MWMSKNQLPFLGIMAHWIDLKWILNLILIDFRELSEPYPGKNLEEMFELSYRNFGILTKVQSWIVWRH